MQPPVRPSSALANFQLGIKGQRPKGQISKKKSQTIFTKSKVVHIVFKSIFQLIRTISRNFALELTVQYVYENCDSFQCLTHCIFFFF